MPAYKDTKRGTWFVKFQVTDQLTGARKAVVKRGFATKREALDYEAKHRTGGSEVSRVTFREIMGKYFDYRKPKERTRDRQTAMLELHFPYVDTGISRISRQMMMEWYLSLGEKKDLMPGTKNLVVKVVRSIFKYAHDFYDFPNPSAGLKTFKENKKVTDEIVWTVPEFNLFISHVKLQEYRNYFYFVYWTGLRRGEAAALQIGDFDMDKHSVHISRQLTDRGLDTLKTAGSDRVLTLPPTLWEFVEPILEARDESRPWIFGCETHLPYSSISTQMSAAIKASGVKRITLHQMRHSFATNAINAGCDIVAVSRWLGHSSINMTLKVYAHLLKKTSDKMVATMDELMKNG